jgi:transglutaminase-like putative cysteine protease
VKRAPDNVRYLEQFGKHILTRSFTARDPKPTTDAPMVSQAWFEAYLGGEWYAFDARSNIPRIGWVLIARGRDGGGRRDQQEFGPNALSIFTYGPKKSQR